MNYYKDSQGKCVEFQLVCVIASPLLAGSNLTLQFVIPCSIFSV